jgi:hypothetical protein
MWPLAASAPQPQEPGQVLLRWQWATGRVATEANDRSYGCFSFSRVIINNVCLKGYKFSRREFSVTVRRVSADPVAERRLLPQLGGTCTGAYL